MKQLQLAPLNYFGKLASRGDFVKSTGNLMLVTLLDRWVSDAMELLARETRWKLLYDVAPPANFAFLGSRSHLAVVGHLRVSQDLSERRFPFLMASTLEVAQPMVMLTRSPVTLWPIWNALNRQVDRLMSAADPTTMLHDVSAQRIELPGDLCMEDASLADFIKQQTLGGLEQLLLDAGHQACVRRIILALGLLLRPVLASGAAQLEKELCLPLPADPFYRALVASVWMELISPFLQRADFELTLLMVNASDQQMLLLGFNGASPLTLHSIWDPQCDAERTITLLSPEWVDRQIANDYGVVKLCSYLEQPQLSLQSAIDTFLEVFIGRQV